MGFGRVAYELQSSRKVVSTSVSQLAACPIFAVEFSTSHLEKIADISTEARFHAGQHIWRQGELHETCYLVLEGQLALEIYVPMHGPIVVDTIAAGDLLGGSGLVNSQKWSFDARALTDVRAIAIDCTKLHMLTEQDRELGFLIYRALARILDGRLTTARRRLMELVAPAHTKLT
jgi:CRP/FNR family cyclic AMP-dependent transcriptional regulator